MQIQFLQYMRQSEDIIGGENSFVDAFLCAKILKENHPEAFEILTTTPVSFYDYGTDYLKDFYTLSRKHSIE